MDDQKQKIKPGKHWFVLGSKAAMDLRNIDVVNVSLRDIGFALHKTARFNGQPHWGTISTGKLVHPVLYTVADHSMNMAQYFNDHHEKENARAALWHDAAEAIIGDMPTPVKIALGDKFAKQWHKLEYSILFKLSEIYKFTMPGQRVKDLDYDFCYAEAYSFFGKEAVETYFEPPSTPVEKILPYLQIHNYGAWTTLASSIMMQDAGVNNEVAIQ